MLCDTGTKRESTHNRIFSSTEKGSRVMRRGKDRVAGHIPLIFQIFFDSELDQALGPQGGSGYATTLLCSFPCPVIASRW